MVELPREILASIADYLRPSTASFRVHGGHIPTQYIDYRTLAAMCRVSRLLHDICIPLLYQVLDLRNVRAKDRRTLLEALINQKLNAARHVRELILDAWLVRAKTTRYFDKDKALRGPLGGIMAAWMRFNIDHSYGLRLTRQDKRSESDLEIALIIGLCRNIRLCAIRVPRNWRQSLVFKVLAKLHGRTDSQLRELRVCYCIEAIIIDGNVSGIALWENTPVTSLEIMDTGPLHCRKEKDQTHNFVQIRSIQIVNASIGTRALSNLLEMCPQLEELTLALGNVLEEYINIGLAITTHAPNLEKLTICHVDERYSRHYTENFESIGNLSTLGRLKELSLSARVLFGVSPPTSLQEILQEIPQPPRHINLTKCLPTSLEKLRVIGPLRNTDVFEHAQLDTLRCDERFTKLRTVERAESEVETLELSRF